MDRPPSQSAERGSAQRQPHSLSDAGKPRNRPPAPYPPALAVLVALGSATVPVAWSADPVLEPGEYATGGLGAAEAARRMTVPAGFSVDLLASEPELRQPVALAVDEKGRVWIAEAHTYPRRAPDGEGRDRILVLEDRDADGEFESRTVFAEGLNLVSGLEVGFGGVWVGAAPYFLFIPDADGDLVPDREPEVLLDGWGYQDTHETLNSFVWGPDGWLYGCHGVFTHSRVGIPGTPDADRVPINAGFWRYHPVRHEFDVFAWGTSNPWGLDYDERGQFFAEACVIPHFWHIVQGARYQRQGGRHFNPHHYSEIQTIADHRHYIGDTPHSGNGVSDDAGGGHAHCGLLIYQGDQFPARYRGRPLFFNLHGHRINQEELVRNGSGWTARHLPDLLLSNDRWSMGIALKQAPDGSVYFIDWYDRQTCHRNEPEIWDRSNGRLYRLRYGDPVRQRLDLAALPDAQLLSLVVSPNEWQVRNARRLLQERATAGSLDTALVSGSLVGILRDQRADPVHRLRALWTLHVTGGLDEQVIALAAGDPDEFVRAWAVQLAGEAGIGFETVTALADGDPSPVVRLYLASLLQRLPLDSRWGIASQLVANGDDAGDHNLPHLIWYGIEPLVPADPPRALELAARTEIPLVARHIIRRAASDEAGLDAVVAAMAGGGEPFALEASRQVLAALETRPDLTAPPSWAASYASLKNAARSDGELAAALRDLAVRFGDASTFPELRRAMLSRTAALDERVRISRLLARAGDEAAVPAFQQLLAEPEMRSAALEALVRFDDPAIPGAVLGVLGDLGPAEMTQALALLTSRAAYARNLLEAVARGQVARSSISPFAARQISGFGEPDIDALLEEHWGRVRSESPESVQAEIENYRDKFTTAVLAGADLQNGRAVFDRTCAVCHLMFGTGGEIGPDITGSNRRDLGYLLENLIDPSGVVGNDYLLNTITTEDGRVVAGMVAGSNDVSLTIRQVDGTDVVLAKADIADQQVAPVSIMPPGQLQALGPDDARDLVAYLMSPNQVPHRGEAPFLDPRTGRAEGALEGEGDSVTVRSASGGGAAPQNMAAFAPSLWSGGQHLWWTGAKPGDELVIEFPVSVQPRRGGGTFEVFAAFTRAPDYATADLLINGTPVGDDVDFYGVPVHNAGPRSLGVHQLEGSNQLTIRITGKNAQAAGNYMVGLDYLWLREVE